MSILITNPGLEAKIRELSILSGETIIEAVERAVDERLARLAPLERKRGIDRRRLRELHTYFDSLAKTNEHLSDEQIIGYDQDGAPK
jgi:antitoxin VapB